jgi:hypothetical protein
VTVTLEATPYGGATITATHYSLDGGPDTLYGGPFVVDVEGSHNLVVWSIDDAGVYETPHGYDFEILLNQPPVADAGGPYEVAEGSMVMLDGSGSSDLNEGDSLGYLWAPATNLDDPSVIAPIYSGVDDVTDVLVLTVTDLAGAADTDSATVTVTNVAPSLGEIAGPIVPVPVGTEVTASATFEDPGVLDTHGATWAWGSGETTDGDVAFVDGTGLVGGSYTYDAPGIYLLGLTLTDDDGGVGTAEYRYVVVYDPSGGFVTGGGWFGDVNFGLNAKFKSNGDLQGELNAQLGEMHVRSSGVDWLVVTIEDTAHFQGPATVNGAGGYIYRVDLSDGSDHLALRVWTAGADPYSDTPVYSVAGDLNGGQIKIHR